MSSFITIKLTSIHALLVVLDFLKVTVSTLRTILDLLVGQVLAKLFNASFVALQPDNSLGVYRTEAFCAKCGDRLSRLFDNEVSLIGKLYCINLVYSGFLTKR